MAGRLAPWAGAVLSLVVGVALLGRKSLSTDEAVAIEDARRSIGGLIRFALDHDPASTAYLVLLHPIVRLDDAEWATRMPSVVATALAALGMFALGAALLSRTAGIVASLALTASAGVTAASQQVGQMPLALLSITLATLCFVRALERRGWWWILFVLSTVLLPLSHPIASSILAALVAALALHPNRRALALSGTTSLAGAAALSAAPLVAAAADRLDDLHNGHRIGLSDLGRGLANAAGWSPIFLALGVAGIVAIGAGRTPGAALWKAVLVGGMALAPLVALLVAGTALPVFASRALIASTPGLALGTGAALAALTDDRIRVATTAAFLTVAAAGIAVLFALPPAEDWRQGAASVLDQRAANETVLVLPPRSQAATDYYLPGVALSGRARGKGAWIFVADSVGSSSIAAARRVVTTPRYALLSQRRLGRDLVLQHWVRP